MNIKNTLTAMKKAFLSIILVLAFVNFTKKQIIWVAIGDSITYLNDHPAETKNNITKGFMGLIAEKHTNVMYFNQGHNGWTARKIATDIEKIQIEEGNVYTIFLGTNDWWQGLPIGRYSDIDTGPSTFYGAMGTIIAKIHKINPMAKIILITPLQRGDFVYIGGFKNNAYGSYKPKNQQNLSDFADAIKEIAKKQKLRLVDLYYKSGITQENMVKYKRLKNPETGQYQNYSYPAYIGVPFNPDTDEYPYPPEAADMTYDGLHPSDKGYQVIAKMLEKAMRLE
jgi:lysophospholipase L1-like esterase